MSLKNNTSLLLILILFGIIYSLIALVNHYCFRTYALDLGLYTHAIYQYAHLRLADSMVINENYEILLGDHFDLYLLIFSPLVSIFGTYTLLIMQIVCILAGGIGVYTYFTRYGNRHRFIPLAATIYFFLFYGIYSAIAFDYHSNVVAAMIIPWFLLSFRMEKYRAAALLLIFILIAKENTALWMIFICLGLMIGFRKNRKALIFLALSIMVSLFYFIFIINFIIPGLTTSGEYNLFAYSVVGNSPSEAIKNLILHPLDNFMTLFSNHTAHPDGDFVKLEMHILVLISGLYLLFTRPWYLVMLIPIYVQKLFHDNYQVWGIFGQYSIEFAPILAIGVFSVISDIKKKKVATWMTALVLVGVTLSTFRVMDNTIMYTNKSKIRFYQAAHYQRNYTISTVHKKLGEIPKDAAVSAQSPFVPHLALRDKIYQFPIVKDADYIVISELEEKYPLNEDEFQSKVRSLLESGEWETAFDGEGMLILRRIVRN